MTSEHPGIENALNVKAKPPTDTEDKKYTEETVLRAEEQKLTDFLSEMVRKWMSASESLKQARERGDARGIALYEHLEKTYHGLTDITRLNIMEFNKQLVAAGLVPKLYHETSI